MQRKKPSLLTCPNSTQSSFSPSRISMLIKRSRHVTLLFVKMTKHCQPCWTAQLAWGTILSYVSSNHAASSGITIGSVVSVLFRRARTYSWFTTMPLITTDTESLWAATSYLTICSNRILFYDNTQHFSICCGMGVDSAMSTWFNITRSSNTLSLFQWLSNIAITNDMEGFTWRKYSLVPFSQCCFPIALTILCHACGSNLLLCPLSDKPDARKSTCKTCSLECGQSQGSPTVLV